LGLRAKIYLVRISSEGFEAAKSGDLKNFTPCWDQASVDLDIYWHAIHFLLTGDTSMTFLRSGVQILPQSEHCEVHSSQDVAALDARLSKTTVSELMSAFDSAKFDELGIYGGRWAMRTDVSEPYTFKAAEESDKISKSYIEGHLVRFIVFVKHAAENDLGIMVTIL
jgi:Domain of unknown function (DUF1877)